MEKQAGPDRPNVTGGLAGNVLTFDASQIRIRFKRASDDKTIVHAWSTPAVTKYLKEHGMGSKCVVCAVVTKDNRHAYCPKAGAPGHEGPDSSAHTFEGEPWREFLLPKYKLDI